MTVSLVADPTASTATDVTWQYDASGDATGAALSSDSTGYIQLGIYASDSGTPSAGLIDSLFTLVGGLYQSQAGGGVSAYNAATGAGAFSGGAVSTPWQDPLLSSGGATQADGDVYGTGAGWTTGWLSAVAQIDSAADAGFQVADSGAAPGTLVATIRYYVSPVANPADGAQTQLYFYPVNTAGGDVAMPAGPESGSAPGPSDFNGGSPFSATAVGWRENATPVADPSVPGGGSASQLTGQPENAYRAGMAFATQGFVLTAGNSCQLSVVGCQSAAPTAVPSGAASAPGVAAVAAAPLARPATEPLSATLSAASAPAAPAGATNDGGRTTEAGRAAAWFAATSTGGAPSRRGGPRPQSPARMVTASPPLRSAPGSRGPTRLGGGCLWSVAATANASQDHDRAVDAVLAEQLVPAAPPA